jgi:hypothetical protein
MYSAHYPSVKPATGLVTCIVKADPFDPTSAITHIAIDGVAYPVQQIVATVKTNPGWLHTRANGEIAYLVAAGYWPYEYVTTEPDHSLLNNLDLQPRCQ